MTMWSQALQDQIDADIKAGIRLPFDPRHMLEDGIGLGVLMGEGVDLCAASGCCLCKQIQEKRDTRYFYEARSPILSVEECAKAGCCSDCASIAARLAETEKLYGCVREKRSLWEKRKVQESKIEELPGA
jgi:hypothetical protein